MATLSLPLSFRFVISGLLRGSGMLKNACVLCGALVLLAGLNGCGSGPSEKDTNPNPNLESSKEGPPKRGGAMPGSNPKGVKVDTGNSGKK